MRVIAIDGPAASGKSSVAHELARELGFAYVNSGAMYRAITWQVLQRGVDPENADAVAAVLESSQIDCDLENKQSRIRVDGIDPADSLSDDAVNQNVSLVSRGPRVREILVAKMRAYATDNDLVMEGRDIGSVVFPDTPFKFYIDASPEVRASRRSAQGLRDQIAARDYADSSRSASPLIVARDADVIDSSAMTIAEVVSEIIRRCRLKGLT